MTGSRSSVITVIAVTCASLSQAATLNVGPTRSYTSIQAAINVAGNGDLILVDPGTYTGSAGTMLFDGPDDITVRGNGGRPCIDMGTNHAVSVWGKGCCVISPNSSNITLENLEIIHAAGRDLAPYNEFGHNGAGIRWDGAGFLHVRSCVIRDCEMGIMGTTVANGDFLMENSVVHDCGSMDATSGSHNVCVGSAADGVNSITIQYCWIYNATVRDDLNLCAKTMKVLYNRIGDEVTDDLTDPPTTGGGKGKLINMPYGGLAYIMGNLLIKGFSAETGQMVRYGDGGVYTGYSQQVYVLYNTILGERSNGSNCFLTLSPSTEVAAYLANNAFVKYNAADFFCYDYTLLQADPRLLDSNMEIVERDDSYRGVRTIGMVNYHPSLGKPIDVHLVNGSEAINLATLPGGGALPDFGIDGFSLTPIRQYVHPSSTFGTGDINKDGFVNVGDLQALVAAWGSQETPPSSNWNADADLNDDGFVNVGDLQLLVARWGEIAIRVPSSENRLHCRDAGMYRYP